MARIRNVTNGFIFLTKAYYHVRKHTYRRLLIEEKKGDPDIKSLLQNKKIKNRIEQYINFCLLLGHSVCTLYGRRMTKEEEVRFFYLSLMGPVFDDFFDEKSLSPRTVKLMIRQPELHIPQSNAEEVCTQYLRRIYLSLKDPDPFRNTCLKLYDAQLESRRQRDPELSPNEIQCISFDKGGITGSLFRHMINTPLQDAEIGAFYQLGVLGQFVDDIFDYYDDWKSGIRNAANCLNNLTMLNMQFEQTVRETTTRFRLLKYPEEHISTFLNLLNILISPAWICLEKFSNLKAIYGERFSPEQIRRKEMICDMEKLSNRFLLYFKALDQYSFIKA